MPSSTSSSDRSLPPMPWDCILIAGVLILAMLVGYMEIRLTDLGYKPTVLDSQERWASERGRASRLAERALILVGASRFQLGLDLDVLREMTGLEPVQLAIDGSAASTPILAGLAADPSIRGTILVDYYDDAVGIHGKIAARHQHFYEKQKNLFSDLKPSAWTEKKLTEALHENLRIYADGANPFNSLLTRVYSGQAARHMLTTMPDRSRLADYSQVGNLPRFYHERVARTMGITLDMDALGVENILAERIAKTTVAEHEPFLKGTAEIAEMVKAIESRGGRVLFVAMPSSGMVRQYEETRYPRAMFWERFVQDTGARGIRSSDIPSLQSFHCPDGSHLDYRDRSRFTAALVKSLALQYRARSGDKQKPLPF